MNRNGQHHPSGPGRRLCQQVIDLDSKLGAVMVPRRLLKLKSTEWVARSAPWPYFAPDELKRALRVLRSGKVNYWTGEEGREFEKEFAEFVGRKYAVALANGTVALEIALKALGIRSGDEVVTTSRTFIASASCAAMIGARPVFADIDRESQNLTANTIRAVLTPRTKAIVAVHLAGWPCEMDEILELARDRNLKVVEDCAQAHGASYKGRPVGSMGDVAAFSFCQDKIITTAGEGGLVTTDSEELWQRMWSQKDHGKSYNAMREARQSWQQRWVHESLGSNFRLSEVQAAVGRAQLRKLPDWVAIRRRHAATLTERLASIPALRIPVPPDHVRHSYYKFYVFVRPEKLASGWSRDRIAEAVTECGVLCSAGGCSEIYLEAAFPPEWRPHRRLAIARELGETSLMLQVHPTLSDAHIESTCDILERVMTQATQKHAVACS